MSHHTSSGRARRAQPSILPTVEEMHEEDLAAERLWWANAVEKQVNDIGEGFGQQFRVSLDQLRSEMAASQERLEVMVERETRARTSEIADVKRQIDARFGEMMDKLLQGGGLSSSALPALASDLDSQLGVTRQLEELRGQVAQTGTSTADDLQLSRALGEAQKVQLSGLEAALSDLRREMTCVQESHAVSVEDLRRDLAAIKEKAHVQQESSDQVAQLHQLFMQSAGDLGRGVEEVSAGVLAMEQKLRHETDQRHRLLETRCAKQHTEVLEALARSGEQLARGVSDEAEKRSLEANVLRSRLDALHGQVGELRSAGTVGSVSAATAAAAAKETDALRCLVEAARGDLSRLERAAAEERVAQANIAAELKCSVEHLGRTVADRLETIDSDLRSHVGERIASERNSRALEVADAKSYAESILMGAGKAVEEATANRCADTLSMSMPVATSSTRDQEQVWQELHRLRASVDVLSTLERPQEAEARKAAVMSAVVSRVEALEERTGQQKLIAARLDNVEGKLKETARVPELQRLDAELKRMELDLMPLDSRLDHLESELRRAALETSPLFPRMDAAESEATRLARDSADADRNLAWLATELEVLKAAVAGESTKTSADKPTLEDRSGSVHSVVLDDTRDIVAQTDGSESAVRSTADTPLGLPDDLRTNISSIIKKVNMKLSASASPGTQSRPVVAHPSTFETPNRPSSRKPAQLRAPSASPTDSLANTMDSSTLKSNTEKSDFRKMLLAVKDLRNKTTTNTHHADGEEDGVELRTPRTWKATPEAPATADAVQLPLKLRAAASIPTGTTRSASPAPSNSGCSTSSRGMSSQPLSSALSAGSSGVVSSSTAASAAAKSSATPCFGMGAPGAPLSPCKAAEALGAPPFPFPCNAFLGVVPRPVGVLSAAQQPASLVRVQHVAPQLRPGSLQLQPGPAPVRQPHPQP